MRDIIVGPYTLKGYEDPKQQITYTRDYWSKLYAGMALQGMWASPKFDVIAEFSDTSKTIKQMAQALVDEMFKDES